MTAHVRVTVTNVWLKLCGYSAILYLIDVFYPSLYPSFLAIVATSAALTLVGAVADWTILPRMGNIRALSLGWLGMAAIIWGVALIWPGTRVSVGDALVMALCLGPLEYALHRFLF